MIDEDRRRTVNHGMRRGRDAEIADSQAVAEAGADQLTSTVIATRGGCLALCRSSIFGRDQQPGAFRIEFLSVVEIDADEQEVAMSRSTSTTSTPPSRSSTLDISPAKRPPTRTHGR